jgi:hypothetical protein
MAKDMKALVKNTLSIGAYLAILIALATSSSAQKQIRTINATAMGTSTQLGRVVNVDLHISEYSKPEDQKVLLQAFTEGGSEGLANALDKMSSKGRIAITGTIGYDVNYIRIFHNADGSKTLRFVTDRPVRFGEAWSSSRSMDYNISIVEIKIPASGKKASGTLLPAARPKLNKKGELEIELYQNAWNLTNIRFHS